MFKVKVLNQEDLKKVLEMPDVIDAVELVYKLKSKGSTELFPIVFHEFERGVADMDIKSGFVKDIDMFGIKLVSWFADNKAKGLPMLIGTTMIFDSKTGAPQAILNADYITGMRTGAAGAIGAKYLAREGSRSLLMVGTGHIAQYAIAATLCGIDTIDKIMVHDPMSDDSAVQFTNKLKGDLSDNFGINKEIDIIPSKSLKDSVEAADIIITATPARDPFIKKEWVKPGTHISCIGADMEGKQEIDGELFRDAVIVVDDLNQAINIGETETPYKSGIIGMDDIRGEIGDIISGDKMGRSNKEEITIFDTSGIALQDLITARKAIDLSEKLGIGTTIDL